MSLLALPAPAQEAREIVQLVDQTPLGAGVDADRIASNVQTVSGEQMRVAARARLVPSDAALSFFLNVDNLLDREYESFGLFGAAAEVLGDDFDDARFLSPAAPRAAWLGVRLDL